MKKEEFTICPYLNRNDKIIIANDTGLKVVKSEKITDYSMPHKPTALIHTGENSILVGVHGDGMIYKLNAETFDLEEKVQGPQGVQNFFIDAKKDKLFIHCSPFRINSTLQQNEIYQADLSNLSVFKEVLKLSYDRWTREDILLYINNSVDKIFATDKGKIISYDLDQKKLFTVQIDKKVSKLIQWKDKIIASFETGILVVNPNTLCAEKEIDLQISITEMAVMNGKLLIVSQRDKEISVVDLENSYAILNVFKTMKTPCGICGFGSCTLLFSNASGKFSMQDLEGANKKITYDAGIGPSRVLAYTSSNKEKAFHQLLKSALKGNTYVDAVFTF